MLYSEAFFQLRSLLLRRQIHLQQVFKETQLKTNMYEINFYHLVTSKLRTKQ